MFFSEYLRHYFSVITNSPSDKIILIGFSFDARNKILIKNKLKFFDTRSDQLCQNIQAESLDLARNFLAATFSCKNITK